MLSNSSLCSRGLLLGALLFSLSAIAGDWKDPQWLNLVHYKKTLTGYKSQADGKEFFLSPEGKTSPSSELSAFIAELHKNDPDPLKNAYCRFPARYRWLKKHQPDFPKTNVVCTGHVAFFERLAAKSLSIVFSSYYLNNPSSSFGHTFIRLGKSIHGDAEDKKNTELLDNGINFGAVTGNAGPLFYTVGGLTGLFPGTFNAIPYYYKVREYNDFETRDLWTYHLKMTQEEIDMIVDHIWELGHTYFDYYFLTENCSYHMLSILEAARPSLNLLNRLPYLYTIPSDTLKVLDKEDLVADVTFRPAPSTLFHHNLKSLTRKDQKLVKTLVDGKPIETNESVEKQALIYDTAISLVDFKFAKEVLKQEDAAQGLKRPLLIARSKIPVRSPDLDFTYKKSEAPHLGHGSQRLVLGAASLEGKNYADVEWRYAFHDMLDYDIAYPERTRVEVGKASIRSDGNHLQLREVSLVQITSLGKWDIFNKSSSWKIRLGQWQTRFDHHDYSTQGFQGGWGYSYHFKHVVPYALLHGESSYISEGMSKIKLGYGADIGFLIDVNHNLKLNSLLELRGNPWRDDRILNEIRWSNRYHGAGFYHQNYIRTGTDEFGLRYFIYL